MRVWNTILILLLASAANAAEFKKDINGVNKSQMENADNISTVPYLQMHQDMFTSLRPVDTDPSPPMHTTVRVACSWAAGANPAVLYVVDARSLVKLWLMRPATDCIVPLDGSPPPSECSDAVIPPGYMVQFQLAEGAVGGVLTCEGQTR